MAAMAAGRDAFLLASEPQFGDVDDRRGRMACEVIQSEAGALGLDPRAVHVDIGKGWGFRRVRSQSPDIDKQSRQQGHKALLAFGCPLPMGESMTRRAVSMPPVGLMRTKIELLAGMPLFGAGADIELAGGKKLEGLPEFPLGDQLSARETRQRLCGISIDHQTRRRSPPPESLLPTRGWETLSPRQQNEHALRAEKYASLLGRDALRRERPKDVAPRMLKDNMSSVSMLKDNMSSVSTATSINMLKDNMSSVSTATSITTRSPRRGWNKYFHLGQSPLDDCKKISHPANDVARWYRANKRALCASSYTAPPPHKSNQILPPKTANAWDADKAFIMNPSDGDKSADLLTVNRLMESSVICPCFVAPPTDSIDRSLMKGDMDGDEITPAETTAGPSTACSSPPSSSPPVPNFPPIPDSPDSELIVMGNITIPLRLQTVHPSKSRR